MMHKSEKTNFPNQSLVDIQLKQLKQDDCISAARIHLAAFPNSSLTKLGVEAVKRYYLQQMVPTNDCIAVGAYDNGQMIGYIFAGIFHGVLTGFVNNNRWFLVTRVLFHPWLVLNPMFREAIKLALSKFKQKKSSHIKTNMKKPDFVVLSIAVDPKVQQKGIGQLLMDYAEHEAIKRGFKRMVLTVNPLNKKAINFYEKNMWIRSSNHSGNNIELTKQL